jgi:hypothetical protein
MNKLTKEDYKKVKSFNDMLELEYGLVGTPNRDEFEKNAAAFIQSEIDSSEIENVTNKALTKANYKVSFDEYFKMKNLTMEDFLKNLGFKDLKEAQSVTFHIVLEK